MDLTGLTAFVTGAGQGIGREISLAFAEAGANVALTDVTDGTEGTAELIQEGVGDSDDAPRTITLHCDVTDEESVADAVEATVDAFGSLDCLVNNAGIAGPTAPVEEVEVSAFEETLAVNLVGPFVVAKHAAPHLRASEQGSVVNLSSIGGKQPYENRTPYSSSKAGLIGLSRTLSHEFAGDGVTVNTINPGPVAGPRADAVFEARAERSDETYEEIRATQEGKIPTGRMVEPEEVADMAVFLASEHARQVTSQDVSVAGGLVWW